MIHIVHAAMPGQIDQARTLILEYTKALGIDLGFQDFEQEMADFPGAYSPPSGRLLLALDGSDAAGCVGIRGLEQGACEMKRLYIRPAYRSHGLGRRLVEAALEQARAIGYSAMYLDTLPEMESAIRLYQALGFERTAPYYDNPIPGALFFRLQM
ncbi:GNAT family N-acetyltransferase [Archangium lipolyticum]|uniref:GNAT family N-acetyltransferase n=1 Tax=Archangium lipolyticum TaxID=2970465 RepID=UPI002149F681|nr:GNAT family N-acetyltransferase [Archangium lipolyticum]